jgi:hypothetical protein
MICVELSGGLGNQMFQYACGRALAYRHGTKLVLDMSRLKKNQEKHTIRTYSLNIFGVQHEEISRDNLKKIKPLIYRILNTLSIRIRHVGIQTKTYFIENKYSYNTRIEKTSGTCFLSGYWQSPKYFQSVENIIREEFTFPDQLNLQNNYWLDKINNTNSISLHIRRTDFVNNKFHDIHGTCSIEYYTEAIEILRSKFEDPVFFIFSDDIEWAKQNLSIEFRCFFITGNVGNNSYIDMQLMSFCKHNIIANSSFSWWGAWLNNNPDKIVIAPIRWFKNEILNSQTTDLIPQTWIRV